MFEIKFDKSLYSHCSITDVLIIYLKEKRQNGKNRFYICDKDYGMKESQDGMCYVVKLLEKGKSDKNGN